MGLLVLAGGDQLLIDPVHDLPGLLRIESKGRHIIQQLPAVGQMLVEADRLLLAALVIGLPEEHYDLNIVGAVMEAQVQHQIGDERSGRCVPVGHQ